MSNTAAIGPGNGSTLRLLPGKLRAPELPARRVVRQRLLDEVDEGVRTGLVLVTGPAGSGKTHLAAEWASEHRTPGTDVAWLTLDEEDRDVARFVRYLCAAICHEPSPELPPVPDEPLYAAVLTKAAECLTQDVVVVLDDFHHVVGSDAEQLLARLVRHPVPQLRFVVLTRVAPALGRQRLLLAGHLAEIRSADLALTTGEVGTLLDEHGVELPGADLDLARRTTRGWVAAVLLVAAALRDEAGGADPHALLAGVPGSVPELDDYLLSEVYDAQPTAARELMDHVGLLHEVCGDLADVLTGQNTGETVLATLAAAQLMTPVPGRRDRWYSWHPLVHAFLRRRLHDRDRSLERRLHQLASEWFEGADRPGEAAYHAMGGWGDEVAARKLSSSWLDVLLDGQSEMLSRLLTQIDERVVTADPRLAVARAFMAARHDDLEAGLAHAHTALRGATGLATDDLLGVRVVATVVELYVARMAGGSGGDGLVEQAGLLLDEAGRDAFLVGREHRVERALLRYQLGAFETSRARYAVARRHVAAALTEAHLLDLPYLELSCHAQLSELFCQAGRLRQAEQHAWRVLVAEERGWSSRLGRTNTHLALAQVAILRDDLRAALGHLATAESFLRDVDRVNRLRLRFLTAAATCASGEVGEASAQLDLLGQEARAVTGVAWVPELLTAASARHEACQGRPERGLERLESGELRGRGLSVVRPYDVLHADLLLRCGRAEDALTVVDRTSVRRDGVVAYIGSQVLKGLAHEQLGHRQAAVDALDEALRVAARDRVVQPFVAPGPQAKPLLEDLLERGTAHEVMAIEVLSHMQPPGGAPSATSAWSPYFVDPLSERELEVLERLPSTMTNDQLAQSMFISVNTLRTHMKNINRKLGAGDRREAVRRARQLGIL